jgi:cation:H+ antiporter
MLVYGADLFLKGSLALAASAGIPDLVTGLTIVAVGTSLPEIATSIVAAYRGKHDIAVGNLVGSNILNIGGVLGLTALLGKVPVPHQALRLDMPVMVASAVVCAPIFLNRFLVTRLEGAIMIVSYVVYATYLVLSGLRHPAALTVQTALISFVFPLLIVALTVLTMKGLKKLT